MHAQAALPPIYQRRRLNFRRSLAQQLLKRGERIKVDIGLRRDRLGPTIQRPAFRGRFTHRGKSSDPLINVGGRGPQPLPKALTRALSKRATEPAC